MMQVRNITPLDMENIRLIHKTYFDKQFSFEEFYSHYLAAFLVEDNLGIITGGGVRTICEAVVVTDMSRSVEDRRDALLNMLYRSISSCNAYGYKQLHAFVENENFVKQLKRFGFVETRGKSLVLEI